MKIAIDGPAGAGKSTIARILAAKLGVLYIDTGAMYRALALKALKTTINLHDPQDLLELALHTHIHFELNDQQQKVICDGRDVTEAIRSPEVSAVVSQVAVHPAVRKQMVIMQRDMARNHSVVMDGRDIGECVLPDADYKFYVTASLEERTKRRIKELQANGYEVDEERVKREIMQRDHQDSHREVGALKLLPDSILIDTSALTVDQAVTKIMKIIQGAQI
ncbi:MAG: (d)CMP kinase [Syntrophomonadaceae bacterium]|jgi:cytidylate kinase|nr:(d)CMP kinase [Bacillota bacterium]NLM89564.1 (d)CMP kinase [Syntrophomonadaceae bacterium]HAA08642.1 (d)CMP kinase [Syntrophomonas sp.]